MKPQGIMDRVKSTKREEEARIRSALNEKVKGSMSNDTV